jgi:hypothetical protein
MSTNLYDIPYPDGCQVASKEELDSLISSSDEPQRPMGPIGHEIQTEGYFRPTGRTSVPCEFCVDGTIGETDWTGAIHDRPCTECNTNTCEDPPTCPICDTTKYSDVCPGCGFDSTKDTLPVPNINYRTCGSCNYWALMCNGKGFCNKIIFENSNTTIASLTDPASLYTSDTFSCALWKELV